MENRNIGLLTSIDWNSNRWRDVSTQEDIDKSNFGYVVENDKTHTYLNFGHNDFPPDEKGYYYGSFPQLWSKTPQSKYLEVIFVKSQNWNDKNNYIVGLYCFPIIERKSVPTNFPGKPTREVNVKAFPKDIHILENFVNLTTMPDLTKILPKGKELGKQGFNYLTEENVFKILDKIRDLNPTDNRFANIKLRLFQSISKKPSK